jgi:hypothetical protein
MARLTWLTLCVLLLSGCSAEWHLKQAKRKDASLSFGQVVVFDTIVITKERKLVDTLELFKDTIIYQDRVKLELKYLPGEKIRVSAECPPDSIRIVKEIFPDIQIVEKKVITLWWWVALVCASALILFSVAKK